MEVGQTADVLEKDGFLPFQVGGIYTGNYGPERQWVVNKRHSVWRCS